jgi:hypothetical protein
MMGWCSGSIFAEKLWKDIREHVPIDKRQEVARRIYDFFKEQDADCWSYEDDGLYAVAYPDEYSKLED